MKPRRFLQMEMEHQDGSITDLSLLETPPRYPPFLGGVENVSQAIASRLTAAGDRVLVICADEPKDAALPNDAVSVLRLPWRVKIANTNIAFKLPLAIARADWDVVSTHLPTPWSADWSVLLARISGRASVLCVHNAIVGSGTAGLIAAAYRATAFRLLLRLTDRIIVVSEFWKHELLRVNRSLGPKIRISPNGVDLEEFAPGGGGDGSQLLFVGILDEFHRYKGLDVLLHALRRAKQSFDLTVVGDGELRPEYEKLSAGLGLSDRVHFRGHISSEELKGAYRGSDIYVLPSRAVGQEAGFTLTALEAMASGKPVVLTDGVGQLSKNAESAGAGIRVQSGDADALAAALDLLLQDDGKRRRMGLAAREYVATHHSWDIIATQRRAIFIEAAQEAARRRSSRRRQKQGRRGRFRKQLSME